MQSVLIYSLTVKLKYKPVYLSLEIITLDKMDLRVFFKEIKMTPQQEYMKKIYFIIRIRYLKFVKLKLNILRIIS